MTKLKTKVAEIVWPPDKLVLQLQLGRFVIAIYIEDLLIVKEGFRNFIIICG